MNDILSPKLSTQGNTNLKIKQTKLPTPYLLTFKIITNIFYKSKPNILVLFNIQLLLSYYYN